jgi:hypothetical protein
MSKRSRDNIVIEVEEGDHMCKCKSILEVERQEFIKVCRSTMCKENGKLQYCCPYPKCTKSYLSMRSAVRHIHEKHKNLQIEGINVDAYTYYSYITSNGAYSIYPASTDHADKISGRNASDVQNNTDARCNQLAQSGRKESVKSSDSTNAKSHNSSISNSEGSTISSGTLQSDVPISLLDEKEEEILRNVITDYNALSFDGGITNQDLLVDLMDILITYPKEIGRQLSSEDIPDLMVRLTLKTGSRFRSTDSSNCESWIPDKLQGIRDEIELSRDRFSEEQQKEADQIVAQLNEIETKYDSLRGIFEARDFLQTRMKKYQHYGKSIKTLSSMIEREAKSMRSAK